MDNLPKCKCDKLFTKYNYHSNGCKYAIEYNKRLMNQSNGNTQINEVRDSTNRKVSRYSIIGNTKRNAWNHRRRFRSI